MTDKDLHDDIYATYRPSILPTSRIREKTRELAEIEELIQKLACKIPFNQDLVMKLENSRDIVKNKNISPVVFEKVEIISYFNKYGLPPIRRRRTSPKDFNQASWKAILISLLGERLVSTCKTHGDILSRARHLLKTLFLKKGEMPSSSDQETISLRNAILCGVYTSMGITCWEDLMFMTFGRNYFKSKIDTKIVSISDEEGSRYSRCFFKTRKAEVLSIVQWYQMALSVNDTIQDEISRAFDLLFKLLPKGSSLKQPKYLAEIIIFHVLKEKRCFTDWDLFELVSPLGNMPMGSRTWLLRYKQYVPASKLTNLAPQTVELYLKKLYATAKITDKIKKACEKNKIILVNNFKCINPRTIAGMACYLAFKKYPDRSYPINRALARMGIGNMGSIINALGRLKLRREYRAELFDAL